jgi:citrate lyase subunit beta/citryl-CoA lyase
MDRADVKPLRTVLFASGDDADDVRSALDSGADSVVIDLEEPSTPCTDEVRARARKVAAAALASHKPGPGKPEVFVRVQHPRTGQTLKDLRPVLGPSLTGVLIPKIEGPADIHGVDTLLTCLEGELDLPLGRIAIYPVLETAQAIRLAYEIAAASTRVRYMGGAISRFGDIHQAVGYRWSAEGTETLYLRSKVLIDAKAAGIRYPISGMWGGATDDVEGLRAWCTHLRDLGYYGMMIGNAHHVPLVHEVFSPSPSELTYWSDLDRLATEAVADHKNGGSGKVVYGNANQGEGHVVHPAHVESARHNLSWAHALGVVESAGGVENVDGASV